MALSFDTFRKLLYQNALEDAIEALRSEPSGHYTEVANQIATQLEAWQKSSRWKPFAYHRTSQNHRTILHNLYTSGMAASKGESPPSIQAIHPWLPVIFGYLGAAVLIAGSYFYFSHTSPCPAFDPDKPISILIDRFGVDDESFFSKLGITAPYYESFFKRSLASSKISTAIHRSGVFDEEDAIAKCKACGANMVLWGRGSLKAHLINVHYYFDGEHYDDYRIKYGFPEIEVADNNFFDPRIDQWNSDIQCMVQLFSGILGKKQYEEERDSEVKRKLLQQMETDFTAATKCITNDSLQIYALHCLAWTKLAENQKDSAQALYQRILKINPQDPLALNNSGQLFTQDSNFLYANMRYEALLKEQDLPYVRLANAEALTRLDRRVDAMKEVDRVKEAPEYQVHKAQFDKRIRHVEVTEFTPRGGSVNELQPSAYLDVIAHRFHAGDRDGAMRGLDSLSIRFDTTTLTPEDIAVVRGFYSAAGATEKVQLLDARATQMQMVVPAPSETISKATQVARRHH